MSQHILGVETDPTTRYPFIVLEGLDGTGKSTVGRIVTEDLRSEGVPAKFIQTPAPPFREIAGEVISSCSAETRFLFFLSSIVAVSDSVRREVARSAIVCDRYLLSTLAYHRALGANLILDEHQLPIVRPDFTFYLHLRQEHVREERITKRGVTTPADKSSRDDKDLVRRIATEYSHYRMSAISTDHLTPKQVARKIRRNVELDGLGPLTLNRLS